MIYLRLFYEFLKTGLFAVGGGLATLPFLYSMSEATGWFTDADITNLLAISQSTPGPLGVNMSTYVGFITSGVLGGLVATFGLIFPSFVIIIIISKLLDRFKHSIVVQNIFYTLRPASTALIAAAGVGVAQIALLRKSNITDGLPFLEWVNWSGLILAVLLWFGLKRFKLHPIVYILISAAIGILFKFQT